MSHPPTPTLRPVLPATRCSRTSPSRGGLDRRAAKNPQRPPRTPPLPQRAGRLQLVEIEEVAGRLGAVKAYVFRRTRQPADAYAFFWAVADETRCARPIQRDRYLSPLRRPRPFQSGRPAAASIGPNAFLARSRNGRCARCLPGAEVGHRAATIPSAAARLDRGRSSRHARGGRARTAAIRASTRSVNAPAGPLTPASGAIRQISRPPPFEARIIPSLTPNFIFRGARFAADHQPADEPSGSDP